MPLFPCGVGGLLVANIGCPLLMLFSPSFSPFLFTCCGHLLSPTRGTTLFGLIQLLTNHYEQCWKYYCLPSGWGSYGLAVEEELHLTEKLFWGIFDSLSHKVMAPFPGHEGNSLVFLCGSLQIRATQLCSALPKYFSYMWHSSLVLVSEI